MRATHVVVASRWPLLRLSLETLLHRTRGLRVVGAAGDWADTMDQVRRHEPDVVAAACLISGQREAVLALRKIERRLDTRSVVVGPSDPPAPVWWMLIAGISGYVTLDQPPEEIVRAVEAAAAGSSLFSATVTPMATALSWGERPNWASLSTRELEVARLVAHGLDDDEVAHQIGVTESTVRKHVSRAMRKLECTDRVELVSRLFAAGVLGVEDMLDGVSAA